MDEINVQLTVINTHLFFLVSCLHLTFIYLFSSVKSGTHSFVKLLSQLTNNLLFVLLFLLYGVHGPFWFMILHRNVQHTKLLGGMCDTVKILSPNNHLFSPLMHLILL